MAYNIVMLLLVFGLAAIFYMVLQFVVSQSATTGQTFFPAAYYNPVVTQFMNVVLHILPLFVLLALVVYAFVAGQKREPAGGGW